MGCAIWFLSFSTWTGTHGIWLEDLYVTPAQRGSGLGQELLRPSRAICVERGYHRLEWWVLDWNAPSIGFYESIGAVAQDEWTRFRLDGGALDTMAALGAPGTRRPESTGRRSHVASVAFRYGGRLERGCGSVRRNRRQVARSGGRAPGICERLRPQE